MIFKSFDKTKWIILVLLILMSSCSSNELHAEKQYFEQYGVLVEENNVFFHSKVYAQTIEYDKLVEMATKEYGNIIDSGVTTHSGVETDKELHILLRGVLSKGKKWFKKEYKSAVMVVYGDQDTLQNVKEMWALTNPKPSIKYGVELSKDDSLSILRVKGNGATKSELRLDSDWKIIELFLHEEENPLQAVNLIGGHMGRGAIWNKGRENVPNILVNIKFNKSNLSLEEGFDFLLSSLSKAFDLEITFDKEYHWDGYIIKVDKLNKKFIKAHEDTSGATTYSSSGVTEEGGYFFKNREFSLIMQDVIERLGVPCEFETDFKGRYSVVIDNNFQEPETIKEWFEKNGFIFEKKIFLKPTIVIEKMKR
ncbi:MAG: hypothetical protein D3917_05855 [Candidatus Electrothrix sp. AX5]|nr:hypothetical protein [Candidatus Electrothrix sp. AX5]